MTLANVYMVAARRSANGRLGGLHRNRRVADLTAPVITQALEDCGLAAGRAGLLALGNAASGGNPARIVALIANLPDTASTLTIDRHAASGLEAIIVAARAIAAGDTDVAVAGGAESLSTAPWRIVKPRSLYHMPRFVGVAQVDEGESGELAAIEATEALARQLSVARSQQDEHAITAHIKATLARDARRLAREIVPLKSKPEEGRDELVGEPDIEDMESLPTLVGDGTLTSGNTALPADGAAVTVLVSESVYQSLGRPPALMLRAVARVGVPAAQDISAPIHAWRGLEARVAGGLAPDTLAAVELGESSSAQAIAFRASTGLPDALINADGGQVARGQPGGAAGAVLAVRLFSRLVREEAAKAGDRGVAVIGAAGGQGLAALLERV